MKSIIPFFSLFVSLVVAGCGSSNPATYKVTGMVTLDGKPVEGAIVTFTPDVGSAEQKPAAGTSSTDGKYQLTTFSGGDGAMPGKYQVTVSKIHYAPGDNPYAPSDPAPDRDPSKPMTQEERDEMMKNAYKGTPKPGKVKAGTPKYDLPEKYSKPGAFTYEVTTKSDQVFDLTLSSGK